ncbi:MAG: single-stranded DNA-binding protein [Oligoflexia bacterium]|nr:single-stranded DNA-binding protein [Oligoflexia bacterium]
MKDVNKVILIGRLGADPVQRETKAGVPVVHFPVATSRRVREGDQEGAGGENGFPNEETQWHRVVAWGKQGELCAQYLRKGQTVFVEGSMRSHKYETKTGESRMSFEVHLENVSFLGITKKGAPESEKVAEAITA